MKLLYILLYVFTMLRADALHVGSANPPVTTAGCGALFADTEHNASLDTFSTLPHFSRWNVGYTDTLFWSRCDIINDSDTYQSYVLHHPRAGIDYVDAYVLKQSATEHYALGDLRPLTLRELFSTKSAFVLQLEPKESVTLVSRFESLGGMELYWHISSEKLFASTNSYDLLFWGLYAGVVVALALYNLTIGIGLKEASFYFYVLHAIGVLWFIFAQNGVLYLLDTGIDPFTLTLSTWFIPPLMLVFLVLFTIYYFDLYARSQLLYRSLILLAGLNLVSMSAFLYGFVDTTVIRYTELYMILFLLTLSTVLFSGFYAWKQHQSGAFYFVLGEGVYIASMIIVMLFFRGSIPVNPLLAHIPAFAVLWEISMFSIALSQRVRSIKLQQERSEALLFAEQRFIQTGRMIASISHQWRQPFSRISAYITTLRVKSGDTDNDMADALRQTLPKLEETMTHMNETLTLFGEFYTVEARMQQCRVEKALQQLVNIFETRIRHNNVTVQIKGVGVECICLKTALLNVASILFENSLDQFERAAVKHPEIRFTLTGGETIRIEYRDNGGGMDPTAKSSGYGMGLEMAQSLVEEKLEGTFEIGNRGEGIYAVITFASLIK